MLTSSETASPSDIIINACDPMQNPGQTRIFYKVGQTRLTRAKRDPVDPDDLSRFQPWYIYVAICRHIYFIKLLKSLQEENDRLRFIAFFKQQTYKLYEIGNYISYNINIMLFCLPLAMIHLF